jgi:hypothetical protein
VLGGVLDVCLGAVLGIALLYGSRVLVLEGRGPLQSWRLGFGLFGEHPGRSVLLIVISTMVTIMINMAIAVPLAMMMLPFLFHGGDNFDFAHIIPIAIVALPIFLLVSAWMATFGHAYWTLAYRWARPWAADPGTMIASVSPSAPPFTGALSPEPPPEHGPAPA